MHGQLLLPKRTTCMHAETLSAEQILGHPALVVWFTGVSGAGKTTLANRLKMALAQHNVLAHVLDGDNLRKGLNAGLGFSDTDRMENNRRTAEAARLLADAGLIALVSLISPFAEARKNARQIIGAERFVEVYLSCPLEVRRHRDPKGLYARAAAGELPNFTGVDAVYEAPENPDLELRTNVLTEEECTSKLLALVLNRINPKP